MPTTTHAAVLTAPKCGGCRTRYANTHESLPRGAGRTHRHHATATGLRAWLSYTICSGFCV
jgi:hypothetical protein